MGCRMKADSSQVETGPAGWEYPSEKIKKNSEWLGRLSRLGVEPGTTCLPVLSFEKKMLVHTLKTVIILNLKAVTQTFDTILNVKLSDHR